MATGKKGRAKPASPKKPTTKPVDDKPKNDPSMYDDPMRNIAAGGTGYNPPKPEPEPKK